MSNDQTILERLAQFNLGPEDSGVSLLGFKSFLMMALTVDHFAIPDALDRSAAVQAYGLDASDQMWLADVIGIVQSKPSIAEQMLTIEALVSSVVLALQRMPGYASVEELQAWIDKLR